MFEPLPTVVFKFGDASAFASAPEAPAINAAAALIALALERRSNLSPVAVTLCNARSEKFDTSRTTFEPTVALSVGVIAALEKEAPAANPLNDTAAPMASALTEPRDNASTVASPVKSMRELLPIEAVTVGRTLASAYAPVTAPKDNPALAAIACTVI